MNLTIFWLKQRKWQKTFIGQPRKFEHWLILDNIKVLFLKFSGLHVLELQIEVFIN